MRWAKNEHAKMNDSRSEYQSYCTMCHCSSFHMTALIKHYKAVVYSLCYGYVI